MGLLDRVGAPQMVGSFGEFEHEVGLWTFFHANGAISAQGQMVKGERHGDWRAWNDAGDLVQAGTYVLGERIGTWYFWDVNGDLHVMEETP